METPATAGKLRDELFAREVFDTVILARVLNVDYHRIYNHHRPHSALGYMTRAALAAAWRSGKSIASETSPCNGLQRPEWDGHGFHDLVALSHYPLPSSAAAILADGLVSNRVPS